MNLENDLARIVQQEERLRFAKFEEGDAWALGCAMRERAALRGLTVVIDIRIGSRQLFYAALPGTAPDNQEWVRRKANVAMRFGMSSYRFGRQLAAKGGSISPTLGLTDLDYAPHGGAFPIWIGATGPIGTITVSGIPQRQDHEFVVEGICAFLDIAYDELALGPER